MKRTVVAIALVWLVAGACAKKSDGRSATEAPQDAAASPAESAPAVDMGDADALAELERLEQALRSEGVALGEPPGDTEAETQAGVPTTTDDSQPKRTESGGASPATQTPAERDRDRCTRICALAESICELETRICSLADEHPGEAPYADACGRADRDCERASQACRSCSP